MIAAGRPSGGAPETAPGLGYRSVPLAYRPSATVVLASLVAGIVAGVLAMVVAIVAMSQVGGTPRAAGTVVVAVWAVAWACAGTWWTQKTLLRRLPKRRR